MTVQFDRREEKARVIMDTIHAWWRQHSQVKIPEYLFSDFGFLSFVGEKPVLASFMYLTVGGAVCCWGYQITNPDSSFDERTVAIEETATIMEQFARGLGYKVLIAYPGNKAIVKRLHAVGFKMGDDHVAQAIKELV